MSRFVLLLLLEWSLSLLLIFAADCLLPKACLELARELVVAWDRVSANDASLAVDAFIDAFIDVPSFP